jgi:hypothetical protein
MESIVITPVLDDEGEAVGVKKYDLLGHEVAFCKDKIHEENEGIALCAKTVEYCTTAVVLAVGRKVNAPVTDKAKREMFGWRKHYDMPLRKGMRVLLPDGCDTMSHPFDVDYEGLIHANDIIAIVEGIEEYDS